MNDNKPAQTAARPLASSSSSVPGAPAARRMAPPGRLLAAIALAALMGAGCSNAPAETGSGGGEQPVTKGSPSPELKENRLKFAECMRENGVADFPDPNDDGVIVYEGDSPEFESAREKCGHLSPPPEGQNAGNGG